MKPAATDHGSNRPEKAPAGVKDDRGLAAHPKLFVCGVNHERAELAIREKFALNGEQCRQALDRIREDGLASEAMVLSTCNRTEIYAFCPWEDSYAERLQSFFISLGGQEIEPHHIPPLYNYDGLEAVRHLFAVNAGLNSMILGENEIKSQIRQAFEISNTAKMAGQNLHRLIQRANRCSKRIRTQTELNAGTLCFGRASIMRAEEVLGTIEGKVCIVIGAGKVGRTAAIALAEKRPARLIIVNRTRDRAMEVARDIDAEILPITQMLPAIREADLILGAAFAPNFLVTRQMFEQVRGEAPSDHKVCLIDAAVPRILDEKIGMLPGVTLLDIGDLEGIIAANREKRTIAAQKAWELVEEEVEKFRGRLQTRNFGPMIEGLKRSFDGLFAEMADELDEEDMPEGLRRKMRHSHHRLKQRLLHKAIGEMKALQSGENAEAGAESEEIDA